MNDLITIALTDDHVIVRKGFKDIITSFGDFSITIEADNGIDLLKQLEKPLPDICIIDIGMPGMNGYDTIAALRKLYPAMKVLVLTMYNNEFAILRMLRHGANGYLLKNCHPNDLKLALHTIHTKGFYHSDFVPRKAFKSVENDAIKPIKISDREQQFLELSCKDIHYKKIAEIMACSTRTVETFRDSLFEKLDVSSRTALAIYAIQTGLVPFAD